MPARVTAIRYDLGTASSVGVVSTEREVAMTDHTLEVAPCWRDLADVLAGGIDRVILFGPPGTGKTFAGLSFGAPRSNSTGETLAYRVICNEDMTNADVTGHLKPVSATEWEWNEGALLRAWKGDGTQGGRVVLDEIDRASGDVLSTLLAMTDSPESASFTNPITKKIERPLEGFSVVMTTNLERMSDLPIALRDRFPVAIRIDRPHPSALERLPLDLRGLALELADAEGDRRVSLRAFFAFAKLRETLGLERSASLVFGDRSSAVLDALKIESLDS